MSVKDGIPLYGGSEYNNWEEGIDVGGKYPKYVIDETGGCW